MQQIKPPNVFENVCLSTDCAILEIFSHINSRKKTVHHKFTNVWLDFAEFQLYKKLRFIDVLDKHKAWSYYIPSLDAEGYSTICYLAKGTYAFSVFISSTIRPLLGKALLNQCGCH